MRRGRKREDHAMLFCFCLYYVEAGPRWGKNFHFNKVLSFNYYIAMGVSITKVW